MSRPKKLVVLLGLFCAFAGDVPSWGAAPAVSAPMAQQSGDLQTVIAQLNAASAKFKSAQADFIWDNYQAVVQVHDTQSGVIYYQRNGAATRMAAYLKASDPQGTDKTVVYDGGQLEVYQPAILRMDVYHAGPSSGQYESFLTLGFGGSGADLEKNWDVTLLGREKINATDTVKLDLKSKDPKIQSNFTHITIWVDPSRSISLKQIFYEPSGDLRTCTYSNIKYNEPVSEGVFHIKTVHGTVVQSH
jgi:outer membrane lipoprotein-sorting protein